MGVVASQSSVDGRRGEEGHVWAAVVAAGAAGRAGWFGAWDSVFEGYAVACGVVSVSGWARLSVFFDFVYDMSRDLGPSRRMVAW